MPSSIIRFILDTNGNVVDPYVENGTDSILEKEAIRVVKRYARYTPARTPDGQILAVELSIPISFKLNPPE